MSNAVKRRISSTMLGLATMAAMAGNYKTEKIDKAMTEEKPKEYKPPRNLTDEQKAAKKAHKKQVKARANVRNGIYAKKITYKKNRSKN